MKIADLELFLVAPTGSHAAAVDRTLLVRLMTADGRQGWGEARSTWRPAELALRRESLLPILAGRNVADVEELLELESLAPSFVRACVEMACWDLVGRAAQQPLCRMWGGEYRPRVPLALRLESGPLARVVALARDLDERGFHTQVVTATGDVEDDARTVDAIREATADRVKLRFDAAGRFDLPAARELCHRLERAGLQFVIDPLATGLEGLASLARQTSVPLAVSTPVRSAADVAAIARSGAAAHVVIDVAEVGGLWAAHKCAIVAAAANLPASLRGAAGMGVSLAGVLQLASATTNLSLAHECAAFQLHEDVLAETPTVADGAMAVPQGWGLGVDVDRLRVDACQIA